MAFFQLRILADPLFVAAWLAAPVLGADRGDLDIE